jgi:hypothetical protein
MICMVVPCWLATNCRALYLRDHAIAKGIVMSNEMADASADTAGPLRHFRVGRRALLQSLATGVGAAAFALPAAGAGHVHHAAATAAKPVAEANNPSSALLFLDQHAFDTLSLLSEQIVPGSRAAGVPEFLDRLLAVESTQTQKRVISVLGAFEREAREAQGKPWKALTAEQSTALLTKISALPQDNAVRQAFDDLKAATAETYYSTEPGMKELGWTGNFAFVSPAACATK